MSDSKDESNAGAVVGGIVAGVVVFAILFIIAVLLFLYKQRRICVYNVKLFKGRATVHTLL